MFLNRDWAAQVGLLVVVVTLLSPVASLHTEEGVPARSSDALQNQPDAKGDSDAAPPTQPSQWSPWSARNNDLQFRLRCAGEFDEKDHLVVDVQIRNVGNRDRYVVDPAKISDGVFDVRHHPFFLVDGERHYLPYRPLMPVYKPESYTLLAPGKLLEARRAIGWPLPPGTHEVYFQLPKGWHRDAGTRGWTEEEIARIDAKAWRDDGSDAAVGPMLVRRPERKADEQSFDAPAGR